MGVGMILQAVHRDFDRFRRDAWTRDDSHSLAA